MRHTKKYIKKVWIERNIVHASVETESGRSIDDQFWMWIPFLETWAWFLEWRLKRAHKWADARIELAQRYED